jgi:outer membrane biosynthesis protein TonB
VALSEDQKAMLRLLAQREQGYGDIAALTGSSVEDVRAKVKDALTGLDQGLSEDQKAMLRLLAQREEGYGDIAALTGSSVDDVRARVRGALAGLDAEAAETAKTPVAMPAEPEKAPEQPPAPEPPPPPAPAAKPAPTTPKPAARAEKTPTKTAAEKPSLAGLKVPEDQGVRRALAAGGAVVAVILLLLVTGVLGGDDGSDGDTTTAAENPVAAETDIPANAGKLPTEAVLEAVDGSDASGQALFGRSGQAVVMLLTAKGLQPSPEGQSYTVSLVRSPTQRLPLVATEATESGVISGRFQVAAQVLGLLAGGFDQMEVSLVDDDVLRTALAEARKSKKAPDYEGTTVLEGPVTGPIVEAGEG